uniref:Putative secreted peptide n=1 Tax=Anopheles braziliensis TaxID=58242 RepID=A0A2M3ZN33_9DIPT
MVVVDRLSLAFSLSFSLSLSFDLATLPNFNRRVHAAGYDVRMGFMHIQGCTKVRMSIECLHATLVA